MRSKKNARKTKRIRGGANRERSRSRNRESIGSRVREREGGMFFQNIHEQIKKEFIDSAHKLKSAIETEVEEIVHYGRNIIISELFKVPSVKNEFNKLKQLYIDICYYRHSTKEQLKIFERERQQLFKDTELDQYIGIDRINGMILLPDK